MPNQKKSSPEAAIGSGERSYRQLVRTNLSAIRVAVQETDLSIYTDVPVADLAKDAVIRQRGHIETYIRTYPGFLHTLHPYPDDPFAPPIVQTMIHAARAANVGPMASVAGSVAERVGQALLKHATEVVVENGGDIFIAVDRVLTIGVYAGSSPLSLKIGLRIDPDTGINAVCTSSGTVGHSLSLGRADAVCVVSGSCALADAAATAVGNRVKKSCDIPAAIEYGRTIVGLQGILIIMGEEMGAWGQLEIVPL